MIIVMEMMTVFISAFPTLISLLSFYFLCLGQGFQNCVDNSGDSGHSLLIPDSSNDGLKVFPF